MTAVLVPLLALGAVFDVQTIALKTPGAQVQIAETDQDGTADLFVLDGGALRIFDDADAARASEIALAPDAAAVDIADVDGDGFNEAIVLAGDRVLNYPLVGARRGEAAELFRAATQYTGSRAGASFRVLCVAHEGAMHLALPMENTIELRTMAGEIVASYPIGPERGAGVVLGEPFQARVLDAPMAGAPGALEIRVSRLYAFRPELPAPLRPMGLPLPAARARGGMRLQDAADTLPESWPWFALRRQGDTAERCYVSQKVGERVETMLHVQRYAGSGDLRGPLTLGPARRYPGAPLLFSGPPPDFNGDGFNDLATVQFAPPPPSADAVARALGTGGWPAEVTVYLYAPEEGRFSAKAWAHARLEAPLDSIWRGSALYAAGLAVARDFNADGRDDFACLAARGKYSVWISGERGFSAQAEQEIPIEKAVDTIEFQETLRRGSAVAIGLRGAAQLYVLRAMHKATMDAMPPASGVAGAAEPYLGDSIRYLQELADVP